MQRAVCHEEVRIFAVFEHVDDVLACRPDGVVLDYQVVDVLVQVRREVEERLSFLLEASDRLPRCGVDFVARAFRAAQTQRRDLAIRARRFEHRLRVLQNGL